MSQVYVDFSSLDITKPELVSFFMRESRLSAFLQIATTANTLSELEYLKPCCMSHGSGIQASDYKGRNGTFLCTQPSTYLKGQYLSRYRLSSVTDIRNPMCPFLQVQKEGMTQVTACLYCYSQLLLPINGNCLSFRGAGSERTPLQPSFPLPSTPFPQYLLMSTSLSQDFSSLSQISLHLKIAYL